MPEITKLLSEKYGAAEYSYETLANDGKAYFIVNSVADNKEQPLNLFFNHIFYSKSLSREENNKIISDLTSTLKSVNATNIKTSITKNTPVAQTILVSYKIGNIEQSNVDMLTSTIASVSKNLLDKLSSSLSASPSDDCGGYVEGGCNDGCCGTCITGDECTPNGEYSCTCSAFY